MQRSSLEFTDNQKVARIAKVIVPAFFVLRLIIYMKKFLNSDCLRAVQFVFEIQCQKIKYSAKKTPKQCTFLIFLLFEKLTRACFSKLHALKIILLSI
jgi:SNF family Na+-dependent transporter